MKRTVIVTSLFKLVTRSDARVKNIDVGKAVDMGVANRIMESGK